MFVNATAAERLAGFASTLGVADIPPAVQDAAALHLLDALGCGLAAVGIDASPYAQAYAAEAGGGKASAFGVPEPVPAEAAALANGIACHSLDFDDTHAPSITHVSAVIVPAVLAAAQSRAVGGDAIVAGLVVGNEVTCRLGLPVGDALLSRGLHPTSVCGVFGATAAVARVHGLDAASTTFALGIAGSMASGVLACLVDGSDTKRIHAGWAAQAAQAAVRLAELGATGPAAVLEGRKGLYPALLGADAPDLQAVLGDLGSRWFTEEIAFKPYPACHFVHAALDALAELDAEARLEVDAIERITVLQPHTGIDMVLEPLARKQRPETPYEAKFSAPFAIGALLRDRSVDVTTFQERRLHDPAILEVAAKVDWELREYDTFPGAFPGGVRVRLRSGRVREAELRHQRGGAEYPMSVLEVEEKFRRNAELALAPEDADALRAAVLELPRLPHPGPLRILQKANPLDR